MSEQHARQPVVYLLRSFPRLSQTFIVNEIVALQRLGVPIHVFALTNPQETIVQPQVAQVRPPVQYLDAHLNRTRSAHTRMALRHPLRYLTTLWYVLRHRELDRGYTTSSRFRCLTYAVVLASLLRREEQRSGTRLRHLHAHFAHDPTLIALLLHKLTGMSYSFTAHARDLYQIPAAALTERIASARAVVTCCAPNVAYMHGIVPAAMQPKIHLIHHGVDLDGFRPMPQPQVADVPLIVSVGRLVSKKGFGDLVQACRQLHAVGHQFRCVIYGDGPLRDELAALIVRLGLDNVVHLAGACDQRELIPVLQRATIFALTPFVTDDGDRDGVPNVLVEAMACGLPVVSTAVAGIPELITHGHDGLLAQPRDVDAVAAQFRTLLTDADVRSALGAAARRTVRERWDLHMAAQQLAALFEAAHNPLTNQADVRASLTQTSITTR